MVHVLLFAVYPSLFLLSRNPGEFLIGDVGAAAALTATTALLALFVLRRITGRPAQSALAISWFLLFFFAYGHVVNAFELQPNRLASVAYAVLLLGSPALILRAKRAPTLAVPIANIVAATMVGLCLVDLVRFDLVRVDLPRPVVEEEGVTPASSWEGPRPDIYLIILDAYARQDVLADLYGHDNSDFIADLEEMGFYVASRAISNYNQTRLTVASLLNLEYLDEIAREIGRSSPDQRPLQEYVRNARVFEMLEARGYTVVGFAPKYLLGDMPEGAKVIPTGREIDLFRGEFLNLTPLPDWFSRADAKPAIPTPEQDPFEPHRRRIFYSFEHLAELRKLHVSPMFVLAHFELPHPPFVFGPNGERVTPTLEEFTNDDGNRLMRRAKISKQRYRELYRDQLIFASDRILAVLRELISESDTRPVILLLGDHGPRSGMVWTRVSETDQWESFGILTAFYLPGRDHAMLYPEISPVNAFRVIFNLYFGGRYELYEDRAYASTAPRPYRFHDVTTEVRKGNAERRSLTAGSR